MATKTAILLLYIRMAAAHPFLRYASYGTLTIVNLAGIVLTFLNIFQCRPIRSAFDDQEGTCIDVVSLYLASAPINVLTDLAILLLPLPILTRLRMEFRQKVALVATFTVGAFVTIVDVIRIAYLQDALREEVLANTRRGENGGLASIDTQPTNFTYHASFSLMWSAVEVSVGLMCCCVLVVKPLIMKVVPKLLMSHHRRQSASHPSLQGHERGGGGGGGGGTTTTKQGESTRRMSFLERVTQTRSQSSQITSDMGSNKDNRSPNPNLGTIFETAPPVPYPTGEDAGPGANDDDDDDGDMDFFQMLAADPPCTTSPQTKTIGLPPLNTHPTIASAMPMGLPPISPMQPNPNGTSLSATGTSDSLESGPDNVSRPAAPVRKQSRRPTILSFAGAGKKEVPPAIIQAPTQNFFDFVNMNGRKPLTELTAKEAWWPILFGTFCLDSCRPSLRAN